MFPWRRLDGCVVLAQIASRWLLSPKVSRDAVHGLAAPRDRRWLQGPAEYLMVGAVSLWRNYENVISW